MQAYVCKCARKPAEEPDDFTGFVLGSLWSASSHGFVCEMMSSVVRLREHKIIHWKELRNTTAKILFRHFVMVPITKVRWKTIWNSITDDMDTLMPFTPVPEGEGMVRAYQWERHILKPLAERHGRGTAWYVWIRLMRYIVMHMWNAFFRQCFGDGRGGASDILCNSFKGKPNPLGRTNRRAI
jgi:hypothetical protein